MASIPELNATPNEAQGIAYASMVNQWMTQAQAGLLSPKDLFTTGVHDEVMWHDTITGRSKQEAEDKAFKRRVREQLGKLLKQEFGIDPEQLALDRNRAIAEAVTTRVNQALDAPEVIGFIKAQVERAVNERIGKDIELAQHINNIRKAASAAAVKAAEEFILNNITVKTFTKKDDVGRKLHL